MRWLGLVHPDMQQLSELGKFWFFGGLVALIASRLLGGLVFSVGTWKSFLALFSVRTYVTKLML